MSEFSRILSDAERGDPHAASRLLPLVYAELRRRAARELAREPGGQTLQPTALVHEAYLRLMGGGGPGDGERGEPRWDHRGHFFAAAAEAMRRILIDNARRKHRPKHGGDRRRVTGDFAAASAAGMPPEDLLALDEALDKLAKEEPAKAELVKLRFFAGLTMPETAKALGISLATAERHWKYARTWLYAELADGAERSDD